MTTTQEAFITPKIVRWARERQGVPIEHVAERINVATERIAAWEKGDDRPTIRQAQNLAHSLHIPYGYLFLSSPPKLTTPIPDLRTVGGKVTSDASPDFLDLLHDVILKQEWYRDYLQEEGRKPLRFVNRFKADEDSEGEIVEDIREKLGINDRLRQEAPSWEDFLRRIVYNAESIGILVLRSGVVAGNNTRKLSVDEFRGFAIPDDLAPLIFINSRDARSAQIFTLVHEIAHLWIGESGISNPDYTVRASKQTNKTERLCNKIAAEVLIPAERFAETWKEHWTIEDNVSRLARYFRVSTFVVLRRAFEADRITDREYAIRLKKEMRHRATPSDWGDYYATLKVRNSITLTNVVVGEALEGRMLLRDAARLLNVKVSIIAKISEKVVTPKRA